MYDSSEEIAHRRATIELIDRLCLPASEVLGLMWFDGQHREILLKITRRGQQNKAMMIPTTFDGYPVRVEPMTKIKALAA